MTDVGSSSGSPDAGVGNGGDQGASGAAGESALPDLCSAVSTHLPIPQRSDVLKEVPLDTFANLAAEIELQCGNCHKAPAQQGNFAFTGSAADLCAVRGKGPNPKGLGKTVADVMLSEYMPFMIGGQKALGLKAQAWLDQGCPSGTFELPSAVEAAAPGAFTIDQSVGEALTDLGNCLPEAELSGKDSKLDALFSKVNGFADLPTQLADTDFVSLDSAVLAQHGTFAYSPTYPLYSDDARKLRYVHVPAGEAITFDASRKQFLIPDNSRFYKTFLRAVLDKQGNTRWRKMETRLIVTRASATDAVYGTYVWNSEETSAKLLGTGLDPASPDSKELYLSKQPFSDYSFTYTADESRPDSRASYLVPGAQRCVSCHQGSASGTFVLGWTPIQMKHRKAGEGGVFEDVLPDELGQLDRLASYGVVKGFAEADLGKLEDSALPRTPRNDDELRLQGYMVGNCAHCHNPNGYAVQSASALAWLDMSPGGVIFQLDLRSGFASGPKEVDGVTSYFPDIVVNALQTDPTRVDVPQLWSSLYNGSFIRRTLAPTRLVTAGDFFGGLAGSDPYLNLHMPLHTSKLDCRLPKLVARWWGSVPRSLTNGQEHNPATADELTRASLVAATAEGWVGAQCDKFNGQLTTVLEDTSERDPYVERNIDWRTSDDPANQPPAWLKALSLTPAQEALAKKPYYLGYFRDKCTFPDEPVLPAASQEPWMLNGTTGSADHPWGQLYAVNPGEHIFSAICANCHGYKGDAQTGAARVIRYTAGARVASFVDGLFGPRSNPGAQLAAFNQLASNGPLDAPERALGADGALKYLVWMADGGTHVSFGRTPDESYQFLKAYVGDRSIQATPIPLQVGSSDAFYAQTGANMLQGAAAICGQVRRPTITAAGFQPMNRWRAAAASTETERGPKWTDVVASPNAFGTHIWADICALDNPITPEIANAAADDPELVAWTNKAIFNAGAMAFIYMRDELTKGIYAPTYDQCDFRYPKK